MSYDVVPNINLNQIEIIIISSIFGGVLLLLILFLLLNKFVFSKNRIKKSLSNLKNDYSYYYSLLSNQDSQYIQKLDTISRRNLLYADIYGSSLDTYLSLKSSFEALDNDLNELEIYVEDKNVKAYKIAFKEFVANYYEVRERVKKLDEDLVEAIKPQEDCSKDSLMLKDKYREVKSLYEENNHFELEGINEKFEIVFKNIDKRFSKFEDLLETASYDEARELLPSLAKILTEIKKVLEVLPTYLNETEKIIPQLAGQINVKYKAFSNSKLPLSHLEIEDKQKEVREELISLRENFLSLNVKGAETKINELHEILETLDKEMDKEAKSRNEFNDIYHNTITNYTLLEKDIIKLNNSIPDFLKYYIIDENNDKKLKELSSDLDNLSKLKRRIDFYLQGIEKTYYTDLLDKINDIDIGIKELHEKYEAFKVYLASLKKDVDDAFNVINNRYLQIKKCESIIRSFSTTQLDEKYKEGIERSYTLIDAISLTLKSFPIDVVRVNELKLQLNMVSVELLNSVDETLSFKEMCIQNITYLNRERFKFSDIHTLLSQAESLYFNGEYKSAYDMSETAINRINNKDKISF